MVLEDFVNSLAVNPFHCAFRLWWSQITCPGNIPATYLGIAECPGKVRTWMPPRLMRLLPLIVWRWLNVEYAAYMSTDP